MHIKIFVFTVFCLLCTTNIFSFSCDDSVKENTRADTPKKIYVYPDNVLISEDGIFFLTERDDLIPVSQINADARGIYFMEDSYQEPFSLVYCRHCKKRITRGSSYCNHCGLRQ